MAGIEKHKEEIEKTSKDRCKSAPSAEGAAVEHTRLHEVEEMLKAQVNIIRHLENGKMSLDGEVGRLVYVEKLNKLGKMFSADLRLVVYDCTVNQVSQVNQVNQLSQVNQVSQVSQVNQVNQAPTKTFRFSSANWQ